MGYNNTVHRSRRKTADYTREGTEERVGLTLTDAESVKHGRMTNF